MFADKINTWFEIKCICLYIYIHVYFSHTQTTLPGGAAQHMSMLVFSCTVRSPSQKVSRRDCGWPDPVSASKMNFVPFGKILCFPAPHVGDNYFNCPWRRHKIVDLCCPRPCHSIKRRTVMYTTVRERLSRQFAGCTRLWTLLKLYISSVTQGGDAV